MSVRQCGLVVDRGGLNGSDDQGPQTLGDAAVSVTPARVLIASRDRMPVRLQVDFGPLYDSLARRFAPADAASPSASYHGLNAFHIHVSLCAEIRLVEDASSASGTEAAPVSTDQTVLVVNAPPDVVRFGQAVYRAREGDVVAVEVPAPQPLCMLTLLHTSDQPAGQRCQHSLSDR